MIICNNCGETFCEDDIAEYEEHHPYGMGYAVETFYLCPYCKDTDIQEAKICSKCGDYVAETREGLCDVCYSDMYDQGVRI